MSILKMAILYGVIGAVAAPATDALAQQGKINNGQSAARAKMSNLQGFIPANYIRAASMDVTIDGKAAHLIRFERADRKNSGLRGEHFSVVMSRGGALKGFTRMDSRLAKGDLPTRKEAQQISERFLQTYAPDLLRRMKVSWIEPHDEQIVIGGKSGPKIVTLTGMKVKMRNEADGLWFWVIVGKDREVMVFERDIHWVTFPGRRATEKWLHDEWLIEKGHRLQSS